MLGADYMAAVKECAVKLYGMPSDTAESLAGEPVELFRRKLGNRTGCTAGVYRHAICCPRFINNNTGAPTIAYGKGFQPEGRAHWAAWGYSAWGRTAGCIIAAKSEHYHISLGHSFHGYRLIDRARMLGIPNATHNNTRGFITRLMEREIIRNVNGLKRGDDAALDAVLQSSGAEGAQQGRQPRNREPCRGSRYKNDAQKVLQAGQYQRHAGPSRQDSCVSGDGRQRRRNRSQLSWHDDYRPNDARHVAGA